MVGTGSSLQPSARRRDRLIVYHAPQYFAFIVVWPESIFRLRSACSSAGAYVYAMTHGLLTYLE